MFAALLATLALGAWLRRRNALGLAVIVAGALGVVLLSAGAYLASQAAR